MPANLGLLTLFAASSFKIFPNHNSEIDTEASVGDADSRLAGFFLNTVK